MMSLLFHSPRVLHIHEDTKKPTPQVAIIFSNGASYFRTLWPFAAIQDPCWASLLFFMSSYMFPGHRYWEETGGMSHYPFLGGLKQPQQIVNGEFSGILDREFLGALFGGWCHIS